MAGCEAHQLVEASRGRRAHDAGEGQRRPLAAQAARRLRAIRDDRHANTATIQYGHASTSRHPARPPRNTGHHTVQPLADSMPSGTQCVARMRVRPHALLHSTERCAQKHARADTRTHVRTRTTSGCWSTHGRFGARPAHARTCRPVRVMAAIAHDTVQYGHRAIWPLVDSMPCGTPGMTRMCMRAPEYAYRRARANARPHARALTTRGQPGACARQSL